MKLPFPRSFKAWLVAFVSLTSVTVVMIAPMMRPRAQSPPGTYTLTDLGTLGGTYSRATSINNCGQIVGESTVTGAFPLNPTHPFIWRDLNGNLVSDAGEMKDLGNLGGARGWAADINASGLVVGMSALANDDERAFRWFDLDGDGTPDAGEMSDLGVLPNHSSYGAYGVNDNGQIVGTTENGSGEASAFIWNANTGLQLLATLNGVAPSHGYAINSSSHIAGYAATLDHAFVFNGTTNIDLGTFGGPRSVAYDMNAAGHAVGLADVNASVANPPKRAFKWNGTLPLQDLGVLAAGTRSAAFGINASGLIVGYSEIDTSSPPTRSAFVHDGTQMYDLNALVTNLPAGWVLRSASAINDGGQIVGEACTTNDCTSSTPSGQIRAFLLTPTAFTPACSPTVTVTVSPASVAEDGATNLTYTFTRAPVSSTALTVNFSTTGTADSSDYGISPVGSVTIPANQQSATVTVDPATDSAVEPNETVVLTTTAGSYIVGTPSSATGTITNEDLPNVSVAVSPAATAEDGANLVYTFTRNSTIGSLTVNFSVAGSATLNTDYSQTGAASFTTSAGTVTFGAGSPTATVTVDPTADSAVESDETVILTVTSGTGYTVGSPSAATGTIANDDLPNVSVAVSPLTTPEDGANLVYTFTRNSTIGSLTVNFSVGGNAALNTDYSQTGAASFTTSAGTVTFGAGSPTAIVTVDPTADSTVESDETVTLTVTTGAGYTVGSPSAATGTITNDDLPNVSVAVSPTATAEDGAPNLVYTFTRNSTIGSLTVNFSVAGGATLNNDYSQTGAASFAPPTGTVTFANGSPTATVTVDPTADSAVEPDENVILTVTSGTGYTVLSPSVATGTITNDDTDVSVTVSPPSVTEDGSTNLTYTFTRTGVTAGALTVNFSVGGTATFSTDYAQSNATTFGATSGTVTFIAGASTTTVTLNPTTDTTVELDETAVLTVTTGPGYNVSSLNAAATGTITNDDTNVSVSVTPSSVTEDGATNLVYTFTRTGLTNAITVNFSLIGSTATLGSDYTQSDTPSFTSSGGDISFGSGDTVKQITVNPTPDTIDEPDETVVLTVTSGSGYTVFTPSAATGTITDDDATPTILITNVTASEPNPGPTPFVFTVSLTNPSSTQITVNYATATTGATTPATGGAGPGCAGEDFINTLGGLTFAAGETSKQVTVQVCGDTNVEGNETFFVNLSGNSGNSILPTGTKGTGTITNDDSLPGVSVAVSPLTAAEDGGPNLVYTFTRSSTAGSLTVNFSVGGTADPGTDYVQTGALSFPPPTGTTGSVTFAAGSPTATVTVNPTTDTTVEGDETVVLTITADPNYTAGQSVATGTITNDDTNVTVTLSPTSVTESGASNLVYTFTRTGVTAGDLTVNFSVGGSATLVNDYTESGAATFSAASGTVTIGDTNSSATVTINPAPDTLLEGDETVTLTVTTGAGYNVANPNSAIGTITPDAPSIILETASLACPLGNCAAAVDSVTFARGPFSLTNNLNFSEDRLTRVILFTSPLGMTDADLATPNLLSVHINGFANPLPIEHVGPITGVTGLSASYIIVKLPAELSALNPAPGPNYLILTVKVGNATSNQALLILTP